MQVLSDLHTTLVKAYSGVATPAVNYCLIYDSKQVTIYSKNDEMALRDALKNFSNSLGESSGLKEDCRVGAKETDFCCRLNLLYFFFVFSHVGCWVWVLIVDCICRW